MYSLRLSETSNGRYSVTLSTGELIISGSKTPTADACRILAARGISGQVGEVASVFLADIDRAAAYRPSELARRITSKPWLADSLASQ